VFEHCCCRATATRTDASVRASRPVMWGSFHASLQPRSCAEPESPTGCLGIRAGTHIDRRAVVRAPVGYFDCLWRTASATLRTARFLVLPTRCAVNSRRRKVVFEQTNQVRQFAKETQKRIHHSNFQFQVPHTHRSSSRTLKHHRHDRGTKRGPSRSPKVEIQRSGPVMKPNRSSKLPSGR